MLLNLPLSYLFLKLGYPAESTMVIGCIMEVIVMLVIYRYLERQVGFPLKKFVQEVLVPIVCVIILSVSIPYGVYYYLDEGLFRFILVGILSVTSSAVWIYCIGMKREERKMAWTYLQQRLNRK